MKLRDIVRESRETYKGDMSGIPVVGLEHLIPEEICFSEYEICSDKTFTKAFHKGQVLFGRRRAYQKKAAIAHVDGVCSGDIMVLEAIPGKVEPSLLPFIIQNDRFFDYAIQHSEGGLSPRVKWNAIANYEFALPSIDEQKVLADKLWAAYKVKESYRQLLSTTDEMLKAKFQEMFMNKGWPLEKLPNIAKYTIGLTYKPSDVSENGVVVLRSGNLIDGQIDLKDIVRVTTKFKDELYVQKDDILMCSRNGSAKLVGKVALIPALSEPMTYGAFMTVIRSPYNRYLVQYFQTKEFRKQLSGSKSSVMNQVTQKMLDDIIVPLPDEEMINQFAEIATQAEATKASLRASIEAIDRVIRSLINQ